MKVSIYIEENIKQVNLFPENEYEENILKSIIKNDVKVAYNYGEYFMNKAGYMRFSSGRSISGFCEDEGLFITLKETGEKVK